MMGLLKDIERMKAMTGGSCEIDQLIKKHAGVKTRHEIAKLAGLSVNSIQNRAAKMGVSLAVANVAGLLIEEAIRNNQDKTVTQVAKIAGVSYGRVYRTATNLNVMLVGMGSKSHGGIGSDITSTITGY